MNVPRTILCTLLLVVASSVLLAQDAQVEQLIREFKGEAALREMTPPQVEAAYAKVIESLLPKMGSEDENEQKTPQQTLQEICWRAGRPGAESERLAVCKILAARLGPDTPKPALLWLVKQLEHIGRGESVPSLTLLLADPDPLLRDRVLRALAANPSAEATRAIRGELQRAEKAEWRMALINALALRSDRADVPAFMKLGASEDDNVRSAALAALARLGDRAAADIIATGMTKGSKQAQAIATDAYLLLADTLCQKGDKATALTMYRKLQAAQGHLRCAAVLGLANAGGLQELPALMAALADKDEEVRGAAIAGLVGIQDKDIVPALADKLKAASPDMKASLLRVLAQRRDKAAVPAVLEAAKDAAEDVRIAAYESMGKLADGRAGDVLVAALVKTEGKEREAAAAALSFIPGEGIVDALIGGLAKTDEKGRVELVKTLATRKSPKVAPALLKTAEDADVNVRAESFKALANLADEKALPSLLGLLVKMQEGKDQKEAEKAIAAAVRRVGKAEPVLAAFASASVPAKCSLLRVMSKVGGKDFLGRTCALLKDENAEIQDAAVRGLSDWPDMEAASALLDVAKGSENTTHRVLALRGYVRVVGLPSERTIEQTLKMYEDGLSAAARPEEKKLVLAGVGDVKNPAALKLVRPYIGDDALKAEAATAMIKIAEAISFDYRLETEAVLREVTETCRDAAVQKQVADALRRICQYDDHISAWLVSKSYTEKKKNNKQLFDIEFEPEKPDAKNVKWTAVCGGKDRSKAWKVNLAEFDNGNNRVAYLRSWFRSDTAQRARLELGSDDGLKVWLNGEVVHQQNVNRGLAPGQDKVEVALKEGWNHLMLKVTQGGGYWEACARVRAADGSALPGVLLMGDPKALQAAASDLGNEAQRPQAAEILTKMVDAISVTHPDETKAAIKRAVELAKDDSLRKEISGLVDKTSRFEDYITTWQVSGPHLQDGVDGKSLFDVAFPPENPDHAGATWIPMPANLDPKQPWCVLIEKMLGGDHRTAYLRTYVWSPKKQDARLEVGSDDGIKVWLNGEVVHANNALRAVGPAQDKVNVTLQEGWNSLLLKITQGDGHWAACARFRDLNGFHLDGLKTQADTPPGVKFVPIQPKELPKPVPAAKAPAKAEPEKPKPMPAEADIKKITDAMPTQARVKPAKPRKMLVFSACTGHAHGSIPWGVKAFEIMGKKTAAFDAVVSDDVASFEPDKIQQFDAICFNNTTGNFFQPREIGKLPKEEQDAAKARDERAKKSLLDYVAGGKGIIGIHAATDAQYQWADYGKLMGGYFSGHPWNELVTMKIDDPSHPVNAVFQGKSFEVADEIYQFRDPYSREALRVLFSLDITKTKMDKGDKIRRTDGDFAVSWVRSYGKGRVFYCSLGHRNEIFWNPVVLQHYLDGIQFALGDLQADTTPSAAK